MNLRKIIRILCFSIIGISIYSCKTEEIILHGDLSGLITDAETGQPLEEVKVKVIETDDSTMTGSDGKYLFRNLIPGSYEIQTSRYSYITS